MDMCRKLTFREGGITPLRKRGICYNFGARRLIFLPHLRCSSSVETLMNMPVELEVKGLAVILSNLKSRSVNYSQVTGIFI